MDQRRKSGWDEELGEARWEAAASGRAAGAVPDVASQTTVTLIRMVPRVLLASANGAGSFVVLRVMAMFLKLGLRS
jgi:hypothetical protein